MSNTIRQEAELDQFGAYCRDSRKELLRMAADLKRDNEWWRDPGTLHTLCLSLIDQCGTMDEIRQTIHFVLAEPHKYRTEYVCAECMRLDGGGQGMTHDTERRADYYQDLFLIEQAKRREAEFAIEATEERLANVKTIKVQDDANDDC